MIDAFNAIMESEGNDVDKLKDMFDWTTRRFVAGCERDIELAKALKDRESTIRAQIRMEVMKSAREIFADCYMRLARRRPWHEHDGL
ncbi:MAG: hypothetical protein JXB35_11085 [Anaerolineae bacterium]|nr:hypothetical protein [Anaerolineae bacterium]